MGAGSERRVNTTSHTEPGSKPILVATIHTLGLDDGFIRFLVTVSARTEQDRDRDFKAPRKRGAMF